MDSASRLLSSIIKMRMAIPRSHKFISRFLPNRYK